MLLKGTSSIRRVSRARGDADDHRNSGGSGGSGGGGTGSSGHCFCFFSKVLALGLEGGRERPSGFGAVAGGGLAEELAEGGELRFFLFFQSFFCIIFRLFLLVVFLCCVTLGDSDGVGDINKMTTYIFIHKVQRKKKKKATNRRVAHC